MEGKMGSKRFIIIFIYVISIFLLLHTCLHCQYNGMPPENKGMLLETTEIVDAPTAGVLERGSFGIGFHIFPNGGFMTKLGIGLAKRVQVGCSFGGLNVVGIGNPDWYPRVEFNFRVRIMDESFTLPAIAAGFDSQGYGPYIRELVDGSNGAKVEVGRYQVKSKGFFAVLSKNYSLLSGMGLHGGINYSLERGDRDREIDLFGGVDLNFSDSFALIADYNAGFNDNRIDELYEDVNSPNVTRGMFGRGKGYLNTGVLWTFNEHLAIGLYFRDLLKNNEEFLQNQREIRIVYKEFFVP